MEHRVEPAALYEVRGHVAIITLNRPAAKNAVNAALSTAVGEGLERAAKDDAVRVIIISGGTGTAFCAGADLKDLAQHKPLTAEGHPEWGFAGVAEHWIDKPVIAAVNGFALGGGTEIVLAADLVIAAENAKFGLPEVKVGLLAGAGGVVRLHRQLPLKRALELALTGEPLDAQTAKSWGLVNQVVPIDLLHEAALELAEKIASNAPLSVKLSKALVHRTTSAGSDWNPEWSGLDPWRENEQAWNEVASSEDGREGPRAFAEKRSPVWQGK